MAAERHMKLSRRIRENRAAQRGIATIAARPAAACRPATRAAEPAPIWMAALLATPCQAVANGADHVIRWECVAGRAVYTNRSKATESIQPLGVRLQGGETLAVSWLPGETAYTLEIYNRNTQYLVA